VFEEEFVFSEFDLRFAIDEETNKDTKIKKTIIYFIFMMIDLLKK